MIQILTKLDKTLPKLYPDFTHRPMNPQSFRILLRKAGFSKDEITPHGFRAMISTICYDNEIEDKAIEWYLAHYETSSVSRAYNHSQGLSRKRKVLDFWWGYLKTCSH